ncbi:MAG TPA: methyltransferase domain-containing protein [Bryobacteraceae bacterium]|jgi:SAM-dependent methyltransferase|nr:methyltransferase domain-containing protein [Bryobacteraceae bacterium]
MQQVSELRSKVRDAYSAAAVRPGEAHAFPVGRRFAESLGYPADLLAKLPDACVEAFAGVSNVSLFAEIPKGSPVLDLGCGAGLDSLIAVDLAGPEGQVVGLDFSLPMLARARESAVEAGAGNVLFCQADAESLPLADDSMEVALVNGIFNLNPARESIFRELGRVVRRNGVVYSAELILNEALPAEQQASEANWFA